LKHLVGLSLLIGQRCFRLEQSGIGLELLTDLMHRRPAQIQLSGHLRRALALNNPAQKQHDLRGRQMTPVEDGSTVERVGLRTLLASPDLQSAGLGAAEAVGLSPGGLTPGTPKALRMEILSEPDAAPIVVDKIDKRKVHNDTGLST
jgi:hypothetical protein